MNLKDKKVLITGADGFIGSHLTEALVSECRSVKALACYNSFNSWGWLENLESLRDIEVVSGDIRDYHFMKEVSSDTDIVFHLAALIGIPYSYTAPASYVDTNVNGTLNTCKAALENGCEKIIHTSTSEVYGSALYVPIDEKHPIQPQSPYSASKIAADAMAYSFFSSFNLPLVTARPFNTYGPRQSARAIIPTIISQILSGSRSLKLGNLTPTRDLNYVEDTVKGFIALAATDNISGETVNIGTGTEHSMQKVVDTIIKLLEADVEIVSDSARVRPEKSEVNRLLCDNSKLKSLTGFTPGTTLEEGLSNTIDWMKKNIGIYKPEIYNL